jgi:hypothetical protein
VIRALARLSGTSLFAIFVGIVVIVVVIFLIVSGGVDLGSSDDDDGVLGASEQVEGDAGDENAEDVATEDSSGATSSAHQQDEAFDFGDLRIAVTDIRLSTLVSEGRDTVEAIEQFATILLTVRNTSDAPVSLSGRLLLLDGRGRIYSPDVEATAAVALRDESRRDGLVVGLQPGLETALVVVFQVPEEAENFRLRLSGGYVDVELDR